MNLILSLGYWTKKVTSFIRHSLWVLPGTMPLVSSQPPPALTKIFLWLLGVPWWPAQEEYPSFHYGWNSRVGLFLLLHPSSWGCLIVRSNELKHWSWEQRKFYCQNQARTMGGSCSKDLNSPGVFSEEFLKANFAGRATECGTFLWLVGGEVTGWVWESGISLLESTCLCSA